ncbi:cystathionine gamma-lyase [Catellatospora sp. TT07R-123]|uniref:cystathionine gamma-lyase n=1 Tax=Catellatospora sp. TT07R-123 TaxID=2733863 RepID=UPI001B0EE5A6|nr:cystathionine gamma-lyase [Catellatospora sp. TT07R-123]GHJ49854.1 cystathionine gamma-lyase [Catellatospora sp. TT07R-123]
MTTQYGDSTLSVHVGMPEPVPGAPLLPGPVLAAPYHLPPEGYRPDLDGYGRGDNPTRRLLEAAIGGLEGGDCLAFGSGQAAITALLLTVLRTGDTLMIPADGYYQVRAFAASTLAGLGVQTVEVPTAGPYPSFDGVRLVLLETPANPGLDLVDIAAVAQAAHAAGALVAVDNTTATPLSQRPLDLGADVVVASGTKAISGHSDLLLGYVATRDADLLGGMRQWRALAGAIPSAFDCWLARRSMGTLALRLRQQAANGAAVAALLRGLSGVRGVRWAGDSPIAARQMKIVPGLVSFELGSAEQVATFLRASNLVAAATSFGGLHSSADRRHQWGDNVAPGFVRLSCGVEDTEDLLADLRTALTAAA